MSSLKEFDELPAGTLSSGNTLDAKVCPVLSARVAEASAIADPSDKKIGLFAVVSPAVLCPKDRVFCLPTNDTAIASPALAVLGPSNTATGALIAP